MVSHNPKPWVIRHSQDNTLDDDFTFRFCLFGRCKALAFSDEIEARRIAYHLSSALCVDLKVCFQGEAL